MKTMKTRSVHTRVVQVGVLGVVMAQGGCSSGPRAADQNQAQLGQETQVVDSSFEVGGQRYEQVFLTAKEVLRDHRFAINRVDAARGVLTTYPKKSVGIATPWDREQSSLGQDLEDFANQQDRTVRIDFFHDDTNERVGVRVVVELHRVHRPNWRVETESIRLSTYARSRDANGLIEPDSFRESIGTDEALARRLGDEIRSRLGAQQE